MRIGLYGGTFDPPHNAHLQLAKWVQDKLELEYIYFIPAAIHACKNNSDLSPAPLRLKLVEKAIEDNKRFRLSRIEIDRKDTSFTVYTLQQFKIYENLPECELFYIIGFDNFVDLHNWKDPARIMKLAKMVVLRRSIDDPHNVDNAYSQEVIFLDSPLIDVSATEIREKIRQGSDVSKLIPPAVSKIIDDHGLYRDQK